MSKSRAEEAARKTLEGVEKAEAAEAAKKAALDGRGVVTMSTGVVFSVRPVPRQFLYEIVSQFEPPKVPMYFNKNKGVEEPNPADPDYIEAAERYLLEVNAAQTDAAFLRGTAVIEKPDDIPGPDDQDWIDEMKILGYPMVESPRARYLAWIKGMAAPKNSDISDLLGELGRLTGVSEEDVDDAVERFRRLASRDEDSQTEA